MPGLSTIFRSLRYRNYRLFFAGQSISLVGTWMQRIALPWLVYHMTGSVLLLGVVSFAGQVPTFILSPFAGALTDRWNRYRVLLLSQVFSLIQAMILAVLSLTGIIQVWHIAVLSIILGCINAFDVPSRHAFVINMVEKKEDIGNAIALNSMMFNGARLIGPSVAGVMLATTSEGVCFLINAISYLFVVISLMMMKRVKNEAKGARGNLIRDMKDGFNYVFGFAPIKYLIILLAIVNLMGASYQVLIPVFAKEILQGGSATFGFLVGAGGVGALAGAVYLASKETIIRLGRLIPASTILFSAGLIVLAFIKSFFLSGILMVFIGLGLMLQTAASNTVLQTITDDDKRGRVMSFYTLAIMGTAPFGSLLGGFLARTMGTPVTILAGGIICLAGGLIFLKKLPDLRKIVKPVYARMGIISQVAKGIQEASEPAAESREGE
jgi:MFS family permease